MNWRDAFLCQARSDEAIRRKLNDPDVAYSHRLHYLQMVSEKLAKGYAAKVTDSMPPPTTHNAFARLLQTLKTNPSVRRRLGYLDSSVFRAYINSLLPLAEQIERLAPSAAGILHPNPEYPWRDPTTNTIHVPAEYPFEAFSSRDGKMKKLEHLVSSLLALTE